MNTVIPTIDIFDKKAVLVKNGKVVEIIGDPIELSDKLSIFGNFQVTDLNRAMENGDNQDIILQICRKYPCYVSGGIKSFDDGKIFLDNNAKRISISSIAVRNPSIIKEFPSQRLILSLDIDDNYNILVKGRLQESNINIFDFINKIYHDINYIEMICVTFHNSEGCGNGIDFSKIKRIKEFLGEIDKNIRLTFAGGISSREEVLKLLKFGVNVQLGEALHHGKITYGELMSSMLNEEKQHSHISSNNIDISNEILYPVCVVKQTGKILGIVYINREALEISVNTRIATFFSRDRKSLWVKGETSGNKFTVKRISFNCDNTAIIMVVEGKNFCHIKERNGDYRESCFNFFDPSKFSIAELVTKISDNQRFMKDEGLIQEKLKEEVLELINSKNYDDKIHEFSDVMFFLSCYAGYHNINMKDISDELSCRRYRTSHPTYTLSMNKIPYERTIGVCCIKEMSVINNFIQSLGYDISFDINKRMKSISHVDSKGNNTNFLSIKPKDAISMLYNKIISSVICFDDILKGYKIQTLKLSDKTTKVVLLKRKNENPIEWLKLNSLNKLVIMSEYPYLTETYVENNNIKAKVISVNGGAEEYLYNKYCDMCVCVMATGNTIRTLDLEIVEILGEHNLGQYSLI